MHPHTPPSRDRPLLPIRWEGRHCVIALKPAGMLSVPGKGPEKADCAVSRVRELYPHASCSITVHRLDMDTSGLLACAITPKGQRALAIQFQRRLIAKGYTALVAGSPAADQGTIDLPLRPDYDNRPYQIVDHAQGRSAISHYRVLAREAVGGAPVTRLHLTPHTGRSHQLRVHCASEQGLACPIIGDVLYGDVLYPTGHPATRLMLHAGELTFTDPSTRQRIAIRDPAPF